MNRTVRFLVYYAVIFLGVFRVLLRKISSPDVWVALYSGRYLHFFGAFPHHSTFVFTPVKAIPSFDVFPAFGPVHWGTYNWLGYMVFFHVFEWMGPLGLQLLRILAVLTAVLILHSLLGFDRRILFVLLALVFVKSAFLKTLLRNDLLVLVLVPLLYWLWYQGRFRNRSYMLYFVPVVFLAWGNLHGSYLAGLGILFMLFLGDGLDGYLNPSGWSPRRNWMYGGLFTGNLLVVTVVKPIPDFLLPNVIAGFFYRLGSGIFTLGESLLWRGSTTGPAETLTLRSLLEGILNLRREGTLTAFKFPLENLHLPFVLLPVLLMAIGLVLFLVARPLRFSLFLPFLAGSAVGLLYVRLLSFVPLILVPAVLIQLRQGDYNHLAEDLPARTEGFLGGALVAGLLLFTVLFRGWPVRAEIGPGVIEDYSHEVSKRLFVRYPNDPFFNNMGIGGYLIFNWWPIKKVYVDTKMAAYENDFLNRRYHDRTIRNYGITHAVIEADNRLNRQLLQSGLWRPLGIRDGGMISYTRRERHFLSRP